jgi:hypothetical protein
MMRRLLKGVLWGAFFSACVVGPQGASDVWNERSEHAHRIGEEGYAKLYAQRARALAWSLLSEYQALSLNGLPRYKALFLAVMRQGELVATGLWQLFFLFLIILLSYWMRRWGLGVNKRAGLSIGLLILLFAWAPSKNQAVIMNKTDLRSGPSERFESFFQLEQGAMVAAGRFHEGYRQVAVGSQKGWIPDSDVVSVWG